MPKRGKVISRNVSTVSTTSEFPEPVAIQRNIPEIFEIFNNVQFNTVQHKKYIKELKKVFRKIDHEAFSESFTNALHYLFLFGEANGNVDRVMQFVANFCGSLNNEGEEFMHYIFGVIFKCVNVAGHGVRSRACQLLGLILSALGDDASLNDDICDQILNTLLERLQDIRGAVRSRAVLALQRLQNPTDPECPVTRAYTFHMSCDPSAAVRRGVVLSMAKSSSNLLHVFERLCDVDESVRKAAFMYVSSINVTKLKVRQRVHILKVGLTERSPRVRRVVETALLPGWLGAYQGNVLELLASVRLDNLQGAKDSAVVAGNLLQALFKHQQIAELLEWLPVDPLVKLIPAEQLSKESAWYWRHMVRHLHSIQDTDHLDQLLPELIIFTGYVRALVESPCPDGLEQPVEFSRRQYVLQELFNVFPVYDMADEVGRNALQALLYDTLTGNHGPLEEDVIRAIMRAIDLVVPDVHKRIEFVAGIISEIHEPSQEVENIPVPVTPQESTETKIMRAELRVALNEAQEEQEDAVRAQNFVLAADCKQKVDALAKKLSDINTNLKEVAKQKAPVIEVIREKRNDPPTLNKCLTILNMLLDTPDITSLTPVLRSLFQSLEVELYRMAEIRESALQTVALYSMLDEDFAKEQKAFFFAQFMDTDNEKLLVTALKCVIDVVFMHGVKMFNIDMPQEKKASEEGEKLQEKSLAQKNKSIKVSRRKKKKVDDAARKSRASDLWESDSESSEESEIEDVPEPAESEELSGTPSTHDTIIQLFLGFMNSECSEYRFVVVEGLCRMLIAGRLSSSSLISRLLLLWFNPATEDEDGLKQLLGTFFPLFAANTEGGPEQLEAAFLPTVLTLANAPTASPLAEVDHEAVLKFIIGLTMPSVAPTAHNVHPNLAVLIVNTLERGEETAAPLLCRALALLTPPRVAALCRDLLRSAGELMMEFTDKISFRNISRFHANLSTALDNLEQRASVPALETLSEATEPRSSLNSSTAGSTDKGSEAPESEPEPAKEDTVSAASPASAQSRDSVSAASPSSVESKDTEMESLSTPSKAGSDKMRRITAAYVARRALLKTPSRRRHDAGAESPSAPSPLATPSRALEPPPTTPPSTRRSARQASTAKRVALDVPPRGRGRSAKSAVGEEEKTAGNKGKGKAVQGLDKQLEKVSIKEGIATKPKGKQNQKAFELFERKKGPANKGRGRKKVPDTPVREMESSSEEEQIEESSDEDTVLHTICHDEESSDEDTVLHTICHDEESSDEDTVLHTICHDEESSDEDTVLHTICHDEGQAMSIMNSSSSGDEESPAKSGDKTANKTVTVPETPETSDQSEEEEDPSEEEESSDEEEVISTSQKTIQMKRKQK